MQHTDLSRIYDIFLQYPNVQTDTRKLKSGDLYFALKGDNFDGNQFAQQAIAAGAAYAIVDDVQVVAGEQYLYVADVLETLQALAQLHRKQSKAIILGITGTNGKTTTKEMIAAVLATKYNIIYTQGNLNNHIGVPLTLLRIQDDTEIAIIEMGANHVGEIASYCEWACPDYGVITNIGKAHLEGFGGIEGVQQAKSELYKAVANYGKLIFQYQDTPYLKALSPQGLAVRTYGAQDADVTGHVHGDSMMLSVAITAPADIAGIYTTQLVGNYNLPNILCAITIGQYFEVSASDMQQAIASYLPANHRSQLTQKGSNQIIVDAYNANPSSMALAIRNLAHINAPNKWMLLGAMKELGDVSDAEHVHIVQLAKELGLNQVYYVGKEYSKADDTIQVFETSEVLKAHLLKHPITDATILLKGSRGSKMEVLLDVL